jgi:hypothetical protein
MNRRGVVLLVAFLLGGPGVPSAQIFGTGVLPVTEVGANLFHNAITSANSVISVANQALELLPLDEILIAQQLAEDLALLGQVLQMADLVWYDFQTLNAQITILFGLEHAPTTREALDTRLVAIQQFYYQTLCYAMQAQALVATMLRTIEHISGLVNSIQAFVGHMQGQQTLVQVNTTMSTTLMVMEVQQAAWQRADTVQRLADGVILESLRKIAQARLVGHPR